MNHSRRIKRYLDVIFSFVSIQILIPIFLLEAIYIRFQSRDGSVIFRQNRPGLLGKLFTIYKFRTMTNERDANGNLLSHDQRIKPWGRFLRKFDLDEIPQLFNILKGDMSLIGPRPLLPSDIVDLNPDQLRRHDVLPGITGWLIVNETKAMTWDEKYKYDTEYVDQWSLQLDIYIFFRTIHIVLSRKRPEEKKRIS